MSDVPEKTDPEWYSARFDPYLLRVGRICGIFAQLEYLINQAIAELVNAEVGAMVCVTAQIISPGQRMRALGALVHYRGGSDETLKKINQFSAKVDDVARQRNRYVHDSTWLVGSPESFESNSAELKRMHITADRRYQAGLKAVDLAEMDNLHQKIRGLIQEFRGVRAAYCAALPPWPRTQYELPPKSMYPEWAPPGTPP